MKKIVLCISIVSCHLGFISCAQKQTDSKHVTSEKPIMQNVNSIDTATFAAGCFWCVEAQFQLLEGVISVESGFMGGTVKNPSYKEVCNGTTGHAEVCRITYDTSKISYDEMLAAFWKTHDPTQLNRQGNDIGTQYRSAIFYYDEKQKALAEKYKTELNASEAWSKPVVTEISAASTFYKADTDHQNYFNDNGDQPYCQYVIQPKVEKFKEVFKGKLKP